MKRYAQIYNSLPLIFVNITYIIMAKHEVITNTSIKVIF